MLTQIRRVIGFDAMLCLAAARGGETIYISASVSESYWLSQLIGHELATKLANHFAIQTSKARRGIRIVLPLLPKDFRVIHLTKEGKSINQIARQLGIPGRTVSNYRKRHRDAEASF
jgi:DNA-binding NarL/FixJ family response regulator